MAPGSGTPERSFLDQLRRRRAEMLESIRAVESALAAPVPGRGAHWVERVHVALVELSADFGEHVAITEGVDGLYGEIVRTAPRLSGAVARLTREHALIKVQLDALMSEVSRPELGEDLNAIRDGGTALLGSLARHRQRGSDLVYEAYAADIGGET